MKAQVRDLQSYEQTVEEIIRLAQTYKDDVRPFAWMDPFAFYSHVRALQYRDDPEAIETVSRPRYTLRQDWTGPRDCDDKTVLIGAYCELCDIPWRVVVCGEGERPHHVYPEICLGGNWAGGGWIAFDATYPDRCAIGAKLYAEKFRKVYEPKKSQKT